MVQKRHKLRLRKQVIIIIPIILFVIITSAGLYITSKKTYSSEVISNTETNASNIVDDGKKLSDISYISSIGNFIEVRQKDNTIIYYAQLFKLDVDKALEIAHNLTNNYQDANYLETNVIAPSALAAKLGSFKSFEAGVVYFIRDLYRYPEKYGSSISEMRLDESATTTRNIVNGTIYMGNGLTFEQYLGKICDMFDIDKSIALAIVHEETGVMTSGLFKNSNNIGGLRGYDGWMSFTTLEAGIIAHVISLKAIIDNYDIDMTSTNAIYELSGVYVNGNPNSYSESWTTKVLSFKAKIDAQDLFTISE